jgi:hypothetical protein
VIAFIRATHPYSFRSGSWAEITGLIEWPPGAERLCYTVRFPDGTDDFWLVDDSDQPPGYRHGYEFLAGPDGQDAGEIPVIA